MLSRKLDRILRKSPTIFRNKLSYLLNTIHANNFLDSYNPTPWIYHYLFRDVLQSVTLHSLLDGAIDCQ
ncbi:hypothetical protein JTE90_026801 [Oedothorax gibbosus]|uniref:Uncharacterized protein n=1 Tax=Oedothorax gibbosus TaxID=931172 RepID=A0AAV6URV8_9ARAC|nr:hypothetical protein JTE90_026801 [Oedothorax gibbosus]